MAYTNPRVIARELRNRMMKLKIRIKRGNICGLLNRSMLCINKEAKKHTKVKTSESINKSKNGSLSKVKSDRACTTANPVSTKP